MSFPQRILVTTLFAFACRAEESDLEQHAKACEQMCSAEQQACASDPAFGPTWQLSCEVSCNLEFQDESHPLETCLDAASSCEQSNACLDSGPPTTFGDDGSTGDTSAEDDAASSSEDGDPPLGTTGDDGDASSGGVDSSSSGGESFGHPCCGESCADPEVLDCACTYMSACCSGWDETCASVAIANECFDGGCSNFTGQTLWTCSCSTTSVNCPDDPFVGQIIFGTDACGATQADALATVTAACEGGDASCQVTAGSCECTCDDYGETCGPPQ